MTDQTQQSTTDTIPWFSETHKEFVENKGWKTGDDAIGSYVNLEKLVGADKAGRTVVLPKDENDAEGRKAFHAKLGVPETADKYELPLPEGDDGAFSKTASEWFHQAGIPKTAAQAIATKWNEHFAGLVKAGEDADKAESEKQLGALKTEWAADYEKNAELSRRGLKAYGEKAGLDEHDLKALELSIGTAKMLKMFHALGQSTQESDFAQGDQQTFNMTPAQARAKVEEIRAKRIKNEISEKDFLNEMDRLGPIANKAA
jgi:hypothetical protein